MNERERMRSALSVLHASENTLEEVYKMADKKTRRAGRAGKTLLIAAAVALILAITALAAGLFSSLSGDELALSSRYEGKGIVSVFVENRSDKELIFQKKLKLMLSNSSAEVPRTGGKVGFEGTRIPARSSGVMTIDLSQAYDISALERPLASGYYFLVLTNNGFAFGQDWHCSVDFCEQSVPLQPVRPDAEQSVPEDIPAGVDESLLPYFSSTQLDPSARQLRDAAYLQNVGKLLSEFEGTVVPSVCAPLILREPDASAVFDDTFTAGEQRVLTGLHESSRAWDFKLLATESETASVLSVMMPIAGYEDVFRDMPLFYYFTYEKQAAVPGAYAFIYGRLLSFSELERFKVYENEQYVCYEIHELIYKDLDEYIALWLQYNPDVRFDESVRARAHNVFNYYSGAQEFYSR